MADLNIAIRATNQAQGALNSIKGGLKEIEGAAASASQKMKAMGESMAGMGSKLTVGVTAPILGFAGAAIKAAADNEQLQVSFTTMLGSAEKAKTMMAELSKFAASTPFESPEIQNASKMLLAFGVSAEDIIPTMTNLGDIAAGLNIPLGDMAYLFGTTRAAGRMMTADLNQFTSRGIPMISALAKTMNVAESDVKALVEAGKVGFPEMEAALQSLTAEGGQFSGLMAAQSQTLGGLFSTFSDTIGLTLTAVGKQIIDTFDLKTKLADALVWLEKAKNGILDFANTQPELFKLGIIIAGVAAAIGPLLIAVGAMVTGFGAVLPVLAPIGAALAALISPLGLVAAGIAAIIALDIGGIRTGISQAVSAFGEYIKIVQDAGFGSTEAQKAISLFPGALQPIMGFVDQAVSSFQNYREAVLDAGFGTMESQESINLFPAALQNVARTIDQTIGAFLNYREAVLDAGYGTMESQDSINLFPAALQNVARTIDQTIGAFLNYREAVLDAGYGTMESQESINRFPAALQGVASAIDLSIRGFQNYREAVVDAGFGTMESQESLNLLPAAFQGIARSIDLTIRGFQNYQTAVAAAGVGSVAAKDAIATFPPVLQTIIGAIDSFAASIQSGWTAAWQAMPGIVTTATTAIQSAWNVLSSFFAPSIERLGSSLQLFGEQFTTLDAPIAALGTSFQTLWTTIQPVLSMIGQAIQSFVMLNGAALAVLSTTSINLLSAAFQNLVPVVSAVISQITATINLLSGVIGGVVTVIQALFAGEWAAAWAGGQAIVDSFVAYVQATFGNLSTVIGAVFSTISTTITSTLADLGFEQLAASVQTATNSVATFWGWLSKLISGKIAISVSVPAWLTTVMAWTWPAFPNAPGWVTALFSWVWPSLDSPGWVTTLMSWSWPQFISQPGWLGTLFNWDWPTFSMPSWLSQLFAFSWPSLPALPGWLGGGTADPAAAPANAVGTSNFRGGLTWVGETGPELVALPRRSRIFSNSESMEMAYAGANSGPSVVIQQMVVRDEQDIHSISYQLDDIKRRHRSRRR